MLTYQRRARWIRRMQDRAARRRERLLSRRAGLAFWGIGPPVGGTRRAA